MPETTSVNINRTPKIPLKSLKLKAKKTQEQNSLTVYKKVKDLKTKQVRPIIQVKNLKKNYGDFAAVDGITFDVKKGEVFGILGPNGAGKTTTLEIIETILEKSSGSVLVDGLDIDVYPEQVKNIIGIQLQSSGFYPKLTLVETLKLFADIYNVDIDPKHLLESVNLFEKAGSRVDQLSGGQKQRFSIATTLVSDPKIVFLDEPTTGLDPQARRNLWDMIIDMKNKGKTIVLTTHYMDEAEQLCDRIAIMDSGRILQINTAQKYIEELLSRGFSRPQPKLGATLEDVFLDLTGRTWRD
jgi:ABC-2 type transport system ATP-binding protein